MSSAVAVRSENNFFHPPSSLPNLSDLMNSFLLLLEWFSWRWPETSKSPDVVEASFPASSSTSCTFDITNRALLLEILSPRPLWLCRVLITLTQPLFLLLNILIPWGFAVFSSLDIKSNCHVVRTVVGADETSKCNMGLDSQELTA